MFIVCKEQLAPWRRIAKKFNRKRENAMLSLQEPNDERDIKLVYCNYCAIIDDKDFDRLTEVFTEDDRCRSYHAPAWDLVMQDPELG